MYLLYFIDLSWNSSVFYQIYVIDRSSGDSKSVAGSGGNGSTRLPHGNRQPGSASSYQGVAAVAAKDEVTGMTSEKHASIRTGLQSIVMDLDNVMNSIKYR